MKNITLSQLADHLEKGELIHEEFNFMVYNGLPLNEKSKIYNCGTSGCAIGEMPALDSRFYFNEIGKLSVDDEMVEPEMLATYFNLDEEVINHLFYPYHQDTEKFGGKNLTNDATKKQVIDNIRAFIEITNKSFNQA